MGGLIWAVLLPCCAVAAGLLIRRRLRYCREVVGVERALREFHLRREWLEVRFLDAVGRIDPIERLRWDDAHWHDEVVWARDRRTGRLLALIAVHFDPDPLVELPDHPPRHATVLFEYWRGRWRADGRHLDEIRPQEAFLQYHQFEPVQGPRSAPEP
jgi:hypothetical protein